MPVQRKPDGAVAQFKKLVGSREYAAFMNLLKAVGPHARTHRISVVLASMLHYAHGKVTGDLEEGTLGYALAALEEEPHLALEPSEEQARVTDVVAGLCKEAKMRNKRVDSRGGEYSIAEGTLAEYTGWDSMPWERY